MTVDMNVVEPRPRVNQGKVKAAKEDRACHPSQSVRGAAKKAV